MGVARSSGQFPLLSRGDINLYSLFVERAQTLIRPEGAAGLLTPSGIASDLTAAPFFKSLSTAGRVIVLFDFENRRGGGREAFFPDVDSRFKFCAFIAGGPGRTVAATQAGFFLRDAPEPDDPSLFQLTAADFARVNPNTGTAPIFRSARDAEITRAIYDRLPVLVDRSSGEEVRAWPFRFLRMLDMQADSGSFKTSTELEEDGFYIEALNVYCRGPERARPLVTGRSLKNWDHRAASVLYEEDNLHNQFVGQSTTETEHSNPSFIPSPQFWVSDDQIDWHPTVQWGMGFRDVARPTDTRTMIAAVVPRGPFNDKTPVLQAPKESDGAQFVKDGPGIIGTLNSYVFDFILRQKIPSTGVKLFVLEQIPVIPPAAYDRRFGARAAAEIVRDHVLRLSYTAHDLAPFARDMGYVDRDAKVLPPIVWDEDERRQWRARLDALYFHLYGVTDEADVRHVLSTFPIVERKDRAAWEGVYLTAEMVIWHMRVLTAEGPGRDAPIPDLIAAAKRRAAG